MIDYEITNEKIYVGNDTTDQTVINVENWKAVVENTPNTRSMRAFFAGFVTKLQFSSSKIIINKIRPGKYYLLVNSSLKICVQSFSPTTLQCSSDGNQMTISTDNGKPILIISRRRSTSTNMSITTTSDPTDLADAISHSHCSSDVTTPDRSHSLCRSRPPLIEVGDSLEVPGEIRRSTHDSNIELHVPNNLKSVFMIAPLAHYLQSKVIVSDDSSPFITIPKLGFFREFRSDAEFQHDIALTFRQIFFFDCLVRNTAVRDADVLDHFSIDPQRMSQATIAERVKRYLSVPHTKIKDKLPTWHLATYIEGKEREIQNIPLILDDLSLVYQAETSKLKKQELLRRSLNDFFRNDLARHTNVNFASSANVTKARLHDAYLHGWLAEKTPIDTFKPTLKTYYDRLENCKAESDEFSVVLVVNDGSMIDELQTIVQRHQMYSSDSFNVSVKFNVTCEELRNIFERDHSLVHYIGHCDDIGLVCQDGNLPTNSIDQCRSNIVFLNSCSSYEQGKKLVEKGATAAVVTMNQVLNKQATKVGQIFVQLILSGFCVAHAMKIAYRRIIMGKNYLVIGDGTHSLIQNSPSSTVLLSVERENNDYFLVTSNGISPQNPGSTYQCGSTENRLTYLSGSDPEFLLHRHELRSMLSKDKPPVLFQDDVYYPDEFNSNVLDS